MTGEKVRSKPFFVRNSWLQLVKRVIRNIFCQLLKMHLHWLNKCYYWVGRLLPIADNQKYIKSSGDCAIMETGRIW
jgi:hypothetical protein